MDSNVLVWIIVGVVVLIIVIGLAYYFSRRRRSLWLSASSELRTKGKH